MVMPPKHRPGPWVGATALVALLTVGGVMFWPSSDPAPVAPAPALVGEEPRLTIPAPEVSRGRCGVVTYTPPTASEPHQADLCRPSGGSRRGAVILVHGGGGYSGDRSTMAEWANWYRDQGFVTLSIDYTLLGDGSAEPVYPRPEQDMKAAVQWTRLQAGALGYDPQRILLHGSSAGARLAAQAYVTPGDPWFAGPDQWPDVTDDVAGFIGFYGYYDGDTLLAGRYYGGLPESSDPAVLERWEHADSVAQAANAPGPALLFHGDVDGLITVAQTERFGAALAEVGTDVTAFIVTDGDHAFDGLAGDLTTDTGDDAAAEIEAWLAARFPA
jgi:acetyl esterase/lipase